jgi:hypothetical protein
VPKILATSPDKACYCSSVADLIRAGITTIMPTLAFNKFHFDVIRNNPYLNHLAGKVLIKIAQNLAAIVGTLSHWLSIFQKFSRLMWTFIVSRGCVEYQKTFLNTKKPLSTKKHL